MTRAQFIAIGAALYGPAWQEALAASLPCSARTVQRYATGPSAIPETIRARLVALLHEQSQRLLELSRSIRTTQKGN